MTPSAPATRRLLEALVAEGAPRDSLFAGGVGVGEHEALSLARVALYRGQLDEAARWFERFPGSRDARSLRTCLAIERARRAPPAARLEKLRQAEESLRRQEQAARNPWVWAARHHVRVLAGNGVFEPLGPCPAETKPAPGSVPRWYGECRPQRWRFPAELEDEGRGLIWVPPLD